MGEDCEIAAVEGSRSDFAKGGGESREIGAGVESTGIRVIDWEKPRPMENGGCPETPMTLTFFSARARPSKAVGMSSWRVEPSFSRPCWSNL